MAFLVSHAFRAHAAASGGYRAEGWSPALTLMLGGPTPAGAEVVLSVRRPDDTPWFEQRVSVPELDAEGWTRVELRRGSGDSDASGAGEEAAGDLAEPGAARFAVRLVSELDGVDDLLHEGSLTSVALEGEQRYALESPGLLACSLLCLDAVDESDAPRLRVTVFVDGDLDGSRLEAHGFRDGVRFAAASAIQTEPASTANDGSVVVTEATAVFDTVRGWNNLQDSGWGDGWHLLDAGDADYEVKLLCDARVVRTIAFSVREGRIAVPGTGDVTIEPDPWTGWVMVVGDAAATDAANGLFGGRPHALRTGGIDDVYALRAARGDDSGGVSVVDGDAEAAVQAFVDRAERLLLTWEADLVGVAPPFDLGQVLTAEAVEREAPGYDRLREAVASVPDDYEVRMAGEPSTMGALRGRVAALLGAARARIESAGQAEEDVLAPFRAVLSGDKREVFEEHPAESFQYATTDRRLIETPEELASAEYWYFEGPLDQPGTATVDGAAVKVSVQGWRVLGYRFDGAGMLVDRFEKQGQGSSAPLSAYRPNS